jgi:hypothetical protein
VDRRNRSVRCPNCSGPGSIKRCRRLSRAHQLVGDSVLSGTPRAHDLKEEAASGEHGGDSAARAYALHLIENSLVRRDAQDPVGQASEAYKLIVQLVGERDLTEAGATLQKARHDANGHLDEYVPIGECPLLPLSGAATRADPLFVFTYLLTSYDDRGYAVGATIHEEPLGIFCVPVAK